MLILGLKACLELNLISRLYSLNLNSKTATSEEILDNYSDIFEGLGCLPTEYKIRLDKNAKHIEVQIITENLKFSNLITLINQNLKEGDVKI